MKGHKKYRSRKYSSYSLYGYDKEGKPILIYPNISLASCKSIVLSRLEGKPEIKGSFRVGYKYKHFFITRKVEEEVLHIETKKNRWVKYAKVL